MVQCTQGQQCTTSDLLNLQRGKRIRSDGRTSRQRWAYSAHKRSRGRVNVLGRGLWRHGLSMFVQESIQSHPKICSNASHAMRNDTSNAHMHPSTPANTNHTQTVQTQQPQDHTVIQQQPQDHTVSQQHLQ